MKIYFIQNERIKMNNSNTEKYNKYASGLMIVKSVNSNFNADFTGTPRRLPDENGTIYATDKSLKYCIRKYLLDQGNTLFTWRRRKSDDQPMSIDENYQTLFSDELVDADGIKDEKKRATYKAIIIENLLSCIDVRLFGITFAPNAKGSNVSITGPVQISYGIDKYNNNIHYTNQILSPYRDSKKGKESAQQTTIGEESKNLESHYVFDYIVNYRHLSDNIAHLNLDSSYLSTNDINKFKESARLGVNNVNSTSKIGSENELFLYIEYSEPLHLQNLKDFVKIQNKENSMKRIIDFQKLEEYLLGSKQKNGVLDIKKNNQESPVIELYFDPAKTVIEGFSGDMSFVHLKHILTGQDIEI